QAISLTGSLRWKRQMVGTDEELKATEAARAALTTNANSMETIRVLRQAKDIAAQGMATLTSDKPLNDPRHAGVIQLAYLVHGLETDPAATQQEKIEQARGAIRYLASALKAVQGALLRRLAEG